MSDVLSQAEIDALLNSVPHDSDDTASSSKSELLTNNSSNFSDEELKKLSEVADMSLGATSSVVQLMINKDVTLILRELQTIKITSLGSQANEPEVVIAKIGYTDGFVGNLYLAIPKKAGTIISDLMLGGIGSDANLSDMHLSALGELMNQMMGRMTTSLSEIFKRKIDITTPEIKVHDTSTGEAPKDFISEEENDQCVCIEFTLSVSDLGDYKLFLLIPVKFAQTMANALIDPLKGQKKKEPPPPPPNSAFGLPDDIPIPGIPQQNIQTPVPGVPNMGYPNPYPGMNMPNQMGAQQPMSNANNNGFPQQPMNPMGMPGMQQQMPNMQGMMPGFNMPGVQMPQISPAEFSMLQMPNGLGLQSNIDLLLDVPLQITVELGRTKMLIKDVLELGIGSVVELNKLAGESVEVFVNNKLIAKGEVVVIDESFAVRITSIINPQDRLQSI